MANVTIGELRHHASDVIDRVVAGERLIVTRHGIAVAELRPVRQHTLTAEAILDRWRRLPRLEADAIRRDLDAIFEPDAS